jgi:GNAT superfamily N-acetyltransferase
MPIVEFIKYYPYNRAMTLIHGLFSLRPYDLSYKEQVVDLINTNAEAVLGVPQAVVDDVGNVRLAHYVPLSSEKVIAMDRQNRPVGFAYCANLERSIVHSMGGAVHPDFWGQGVGSLLVKWAMERAAANALDAPLGIRVVLQTDLFEAQGQAIQLFEDLGFQKVRTWAHMVVELSSRPKAPHLIDPLRLREMDLDNDWDIVRPAMDEAFADHWGAIVEPEESATGVQAQHPDLNEPSQEEEKLVEDESYSNAAGFCFIAMNGEEVVGGILCNNRLVERGDTGRVGSLFVRPKYQRQGVGRALMLAAFNAFWDAGIKQIVTDTDAESFKEAPKFYASLGMQVYRQEFLFEKEIRPGQEVRRLSV